MNIKKLLAVILTVAMIISIVPAVNNNESAKAAENFEITSPTENKLIGAGYFDIKWSEVETDTSELKEYKLYLDNELIGTTKENSYECYTTEVKMYSAYVVAEFEDGETQTTDTVTFGVTKKGICIDNNMGKYLNPTYLNIGWYYNWGTSPSSFRYFKGYDYVPMIWGKEQGGSESAVKNQISNFINKGYKYVLGYNEPDLQGQALMSVNEVLALWPSFMNDNINVGSPATALWPKASENWFQPFMQQVNASDNMNVDFIAVHCYPDNFQGAAMAEWFLEEVVDATWEMYHKPIWITEFSTTGKNITSKGTIEFLKAVMPGLDEREYVERYSFFSFNAADNPAGLFNHDTGAITSAGLVYANLGNPEGYVPTPYVEPDYKVVTSTQRVLLSNKVFINKVGCTDYVKDDNVTASATSENGNDRKAQLAIDEDISSRWESKHGIDPQSLTIDLGTVCNIKRVSIVWEDASASAYDIEVSTDGINYTKVAEEINETHYNNKCDAITFDKMKSARYVRINGTERATRYGYSIFDVAIYGTDDLKVDETTTKASVQETTTKKQSVETTTSNKIKISRAKVKKASKKKSSKKISIKLKKIKGVKGYKIQISTTKKFKKVLVKKTVKKVKFTIKSKKIKNKKKLYVRAKAYKIINGKKHYGSWSKAKKVKIKK